MGVKATVHMKDGTVKGFYLCARIEYAPGFVVVHYQENHQREPMRKISIPADTIDHIEEVDREDRF